MILKSKSVVEEFMPSIILEEARMSPVNGLVIKPVKPATVPFKAP